jgi:MutS domain V
MIKKVPKIFFLCGMALFSALSGEGKTLRSISEAERAEVERKYNFRIADREEPVEEEGEKKCPSLTPAEILSAAFSFTPEDAVENTDVLDEPVIDKLLLLKNERERRFVLETVFNGHVKTGFGQVQTFFTLSNPTTNLTTIRNRQQAISLLCANAPLVESAHKEFSIMSAAEEKSLMTFQSQKRVFRQDEKLPDLPMISADSFRDLRRTPLVRDAAIAVDSVFSGIQIPGMVGFGRDAAHSLSDATSAASKDAGGGTALVQGSMALALGGITFYQFSVLHKKLKNCSRSRDLVGETQKHVRALSNLSDLLNKSPQILTHLPELQPLADFNNPTRHSAELNYFVNLLNYYDFQGEDSVLYRKGPTLAAAECLKSDALKKELASVLVAGGKLEMYVAAAKLYSETESQQVRYCIPRFIENNPTPFLDAQNFWNPYLTPDKAVTNSIRFDQQSPNAIITGPNTGGKSTAMKALMLNVLMAQSFGIAPSENLTLTPFDKMSCLMNNADDITKQASLFKAEALNAKDIMSTAQNLKKNQFGFFILDEIFSGTSPDAGELATRKYAAKLAQEKNVISVIATHYKDIADKKNPLTRYKNFQMGFKRSADGALERTYKIEPGESEANVAFDILREVGLEI